MAGKLVCINKYFETYTYGKVYELIKDKGSYYIILNDKEDLGSPSKETLGKPNFISLEEFRNQKNEKIIF